MASGATLLRRWSNKKRTLTFHCVATQEHLIYKNYFKLGGYMGHISAQDA